jgi:chromosome segregation ATPase
MAETAANVIAIKNDEHTKLNEINELKSTLKFMDWTIQLQSIAASAGLPVCKELGQEDTKIQAHSFAGRLNYPTIHAFITDKNGLAMSWNDWSDRVTAYSLREKFGIYASTAEEIIHQHKDVEAILKRPPANAAEFHKAKDAVFLSQKQQAEKKNAEEFSLLNKQINSITNERDLSVLSLNIEKDRTVKLSIDLKAAIESIDVRLAEAKRTFNNEKEIELQALKLSFEKELEANTVAIKLQNKQELESINYEMEQLKSYYNSDNFVSRNEYMVVEHELANERSNNRDYIRKLNDATSQYELAASQINGLKENEVDLTAKIASAEALIESLKKEIVELNNLSLGEISYGAMHMQQKIVELQSAVDTLKKTNEGMGHQVTFLNKNITNLKLSLANAIASNNKIRAFAIKQKGKNKILKAMVFFAVGSIAAMLTVTGLPL